MADCKVNGFINADTDVSIHGDYSVTNWKVEENILSFTITNLTGTAKRPQLLLAEYAGSELTNIRTLPIPLAENDGSQNVTQVVPRNTKVFLWDGLNPIIDIPVVYQYV